MKNFTPRVMLTYNNEPVVVFGYRNVTHRHFAVTVTPADSIGVVALDTLRDLRQAKWDGADYPPARAAIYWMHTGRRSISKRARGVLNAIIARETPRPLSVADMC